MSATPILILDDDPDVAIAARLLLRRRLGEVAELQQPRQLLAEIERHQPSVLLLDMNFTPGRLDGGEGLAVLRQLASLPKAPAVIVMTAYAEVALAVEAVKLGAFDFITKPWDNAKLLATVGAALASRETVPEPKVGGLLGQSRAMQELRGLIASVAPTEANVLILGENGVGKELVARAIHEASHRADGTFLAVDMGALPESTFESELFGHRKGSFTDARQDRSGRFQAARSGTLFLDEIGNMPLANQAKLLTALERREVTPVGADRPEAIDVRIVSATNLEEAALFSPAQFRPDLLYRLNTIVLRVPPLRARRDDIPLLVEHYLCRYAQQYGKPVRPLGATTLAALAAYDWPGNVRSLKHACERAVILAQGPEYSPADFALGVPTQVPVTSAAPAGVTADELKLSERERDAIAAALQRAEGNISQAAKLLGVSRAALYRKLEKHGL
ncbi:sigma-54 dependent transcriptional regulator [Chitinimonas sp.]|uniref:sigma-54-dependent transcriptional regulator n=1 Tax=Chitinimonas sp. TaxID=1934313 RepID=UPI002F939AF4